MNKTTARWLSALGGISAIGVSLCFSQATQGSELNSGSRRNPTDVILSDWQGRWDCNLDGRQTTLDFKLIEQSFCQGNICQNAFKVTGQMIDGNTVVSELESREYGPGDPPTARLDHLLPMRFKSTEEWLPLLLMMHTGNRNYASGFVRWNGIPYGLQCQRATSR
ncbi:hypothetical protein Cri9333_2798 [Crinalium epipsammum PCC 9333]|uniref:Uncharacterized protein n=1 Tax=Crinalium epipsammum PCC 9333 TaxID=1173022 RepID=K9W1G9_9CYAN|nr:DUF6006 family protein [Crinalium epipsammum]AFZ13644.1 hypothetical protein Cri9333_2798 [Crinalium epipsammum PCC 9333]